MLLCVKPRAFAEVLTLSTVSGRFAPHSCGLKRKLLSVISPGQSEAPRIWLHGFGDIPEGPAPLSQVDGAAVDRTVEHSPPVRMGVRTGAFETGNQWVRSPRCRVITLVSLPLLALWSPLEPACLRLLQRVSSWPVGGAGTSCWGPNTALTVPSLSKFGQKTSSGRL